MLPKTKRFTKEDFVGKRPKVFFRGTLFDVAGLLSAQSGKTSELPNSSVNKSTQKFACITSKKTLKRAVDRNLIKRRVFSIVQELVRPNGYSIVFYPKKGSAIIPYSQLREEIQKAFDTLCTKRVESSV